MWQFERLPVECSGAVEGQRVGRLVAGEDIVDASFGRLATAVEVNRQGFLLHAAGGFQRKRQAEMTAANVSDRHSGNHGFPNAIVIGLDEIRHVRSRSADW